MKNFLGALMMSIALTSTSFGFGLFDRMLGSGCGCCCEPSCGCCEKSCCCEQSCGCNNGCGCDSCGGSDCCNGGEKHDGDKGDAPKAPAEAGASVKPIPPRPMSDPNARVGQQRNVVRTSFRR